MTTTEPSKRTSQHIGVYSFPVPYAVCLSRMPSHRQDSSPSGALTFLTALRGSQQMPNGRKICPSQQLLPAPRQIPELFLAVLLDLSSDVSHVWAVMWSILAALCSWKLFPFDGFLHISNSCEWGVLWLVRGNTDLCRWRKEPRLGALLHPPVASLGTTCNFQTLSPTLTSPLCLLQVPSFLTKIMFTSRFCNCQKPPSPSWPRYSTSPRHMT